MTEIDVATVADSAFFVDRRESAEAEAGDYRAALEAGAIGPDHIRAEIGEVLRHRRRQTTTIYAKVDLGALRTLALPWPGGAR